VTVQRTFELALGHHQSGQLAKAEPLYRQILAAQPDHAEALHMLGLLAHQSGHHDAAGDLIKKAIALIPGDAGCHSNLCDVERVRRRFDEALAAARRAIELRPDFANAHNNLGNVFTDMGRGEEAIAAYRRALELTPDDAEVCRNLGNVLYDTGRLEEAVSVFRLATSLQPENADAHSSLGNALRDIGQIDEAIAACRRAIALRHDFPEAHFHLGIALYAKGQPDAAIAAYRQAVALKPNFPEAYYNLGITLDGVGRLEETITAYRQAIALKPDYFQAHTNLGTALKDKGLLDDACAAYRRAMALQPDDPDAHSNLVYALHFHHGHDARSISQEHRRWNQQHAEPLRKFVQSHSNDCTPGRRLRIGYVSPDFRRQAESYFVVPLFEAHDRDRYEIHAYSSVSRPDRITERLHRSVSAWHDVTELRDEDLAEKIRREGIDILVDLTMHMAHNRLLLFARKPAPVQVTWLAYPGSTGLEAMDYRFTDAFMDPPSASSEGYSEDSVRLPDSWCCYDPMSNLPQSPVEPAHRGEFLRFGSLNNFCKLNEPLLRLWAQVLAAVPGSRLLLLAPEGGHREQLRKTFETMGIAGDRVEYCGKCSRDEYLRRYDRIDIALDPLPYNGITTTLDALWMGVPVVSLTGETAAGRAGLSLLSTVGLPELATRTTEEFVRVASGLAQDLPRLSALRSTLRQRMECSPLMDAPRFARNMEAAFREMWCNWCRGVESEACVEGRREP
jgi:protein O-GlcNAc transferase